MKAHLHSLLAGLLASVVLAALVPGNLAHGWVRQPTTLDAHLLEADFAAFVTIAEIESVNDDASLRSLSFRNYHVLWSRWQKPPERMVARAFPHRDEGVDGVRIAATSETVQTGGRYLIMLRGGAWHASPLVSSAKSIFPVVDNIVRCHAGEVYGTTPTGLLCSRQERQVNHPLSEEELAQQLSSARERARDRRPELARERDRLVAPMTQTLAPGAHR